MLSLSCKRDLLIDLNDVGSWLGQSFLGKLIHLKSSRWSYMVLLNVIGLEIVTIEKDIGYTFLPLQEYNLYFCFCLDSEAAFVIETQMVVIICMQIK